MFLKCYYSDPQDDWDELLTAAYFAFHFSVFENLRGSPFKMDLESSL